MPMVDIRRDCARLWLADCTEQEAAQISSLTAREVQHLRHIVAHRVGVEESIRRLDIVCFGRHASLERAPTIAKEWLYRRSARALWVTELRVALVRVSGDGHVRRLLIHELVHGLLDLLSGGFPYPLGIQEGLARASELMLPDPCGVALADLRGVSANETAQEFLEPAQCMTIRELLAFGQDEYDNVDMASYSRMVVVALWFNVFVARCAQRHGRLRNILAEIREQNLASADDIYRWLQEVTKWEPEQLERRFREFCIQGSPPLQTRPGDLGL